MSNRHNNTNRDRHQDNDDVVVDNTYDVTGQTYTRQSLEALSEGELGHVETSMIRHINSLRSKGKKTYPYEVELCYVQDEINRRADMAAAAAEYAKRHNPGWSLQGDQAGVDAE